MASAVPQMLRHLSRCQTTCIRNSQQQRRWARVHDVRFLATHQAQERVTERYKRKLEQKAGQEGLADIAELKEAYKEKIKEHRRSAAVPGATAPLHSATTGTTYPSSSSSSSPSPRSTISSSSSPTSAWPKPPPPPPAHALDQTPPTPPNHTPPGIKTLSSFLDVTKILELPPREIEGIWRLRHANTKNSLCASIPAATWRAIAATARQHPQFILPGLPRAAAEPASPTESEQGEAGAQEGAHIHFLQWTFPSPDTATVMFTHLAEFKLRGEYSQPHTTLTHHLELLDPKEVVLCQGGIVEGRGVSVEEGRWLVMCLQKFYNSVESATQGTAAGGGIGTELNRRRRRLMEQFSSGDSAFSVQELLEETERLG